MASKRCRSIRGTNVCFQVAKPTPPKRRVSKHAIYIDTRTGGGVFLQRGAAGTELGPIIDRANQQRLAGIIERAADQAQMVIHGCVGEGELAKGCFITPSMFEIDDVSHDLVQDELFGPIVSLERFDDEADALAMANATRYGLAASSILQI